MDIQRHSSVLGDTVEKLSDEASYKQLFHAYRDEEALPSGEVLKEIIDLCRAILFPGYYGNARISKQTIRFHTGVNVETLHSLLSKQVYAGLCFADTSCVTCPEEKISAEAEAISEAFISTLPEIRGLLATDVEATFNGDPAAQNLGEVIFCYPGFRAIGNYRIAHQLYKLGVPYIPRMITEMAHSETGIDIHPGAKIGHHFSIDHGTGTVIGETSVIGNYVRIFQGVSLAGEKLPPDENGNAIRGVARHPILEDHVTVYSNSTLIGKIRIGRGATICGNVWIAEDVPAVDRAVAALERGDLFVEEADGAVVGTGIFNRLQADVYAGAPWQYDAPDDQIMVLHTLAVDPQAGKRGLGRAFAAFYEQYAREHGCRYLRIDTNERTEALHASNDHRCWI